MTRSAASSTNTPELRRPDDVFGTHNSSATTVSVTLRLQEREDSPGMTLGVTVSDDGQGGANVGPGGGLRGLGDRVSALGGTLEIRSPVGGTSLSADLPVLVTPRSPRG